MRYGIALLLLAVLPAGSAQTTNLNFAQRSITLTLHADVSRVLRAFGPEEEKLWSPGWEPKIISLQGDPADPDFAVFIISHGAADTIWTLSAHDRERGMLQYVVINPGKIVTVIEIRCSSAGEHLTRAIVTYRKTALNPEANTEISQFAQHFTEQRAHWEQTIDQFLRTNQNKQPNQ